MWSRKPTPVAALASPPSRSSESLIWVSAVLRSLVCRAAHLAPNHRGLAVDGEALGAGERVGVRGQRRGGLGRELDGGDPAAEGAGPERAREATGAAGRQDVVGAGDVVAEGGGAVAADEDAAGGRDPVGEQRCVLLDQLAGARGRRRWRASIASLDVGNLDQRQRRVGDAGARRPRRARWRAAIASSTCSSTATTTSGLSAPCSAWAQRSSAAHSGSVSWPAISISSEGPAQRVDPDRAVDGPLGLLHPGVAGAGDHVDRGDRLGPVGEREDRLGAAHRVDLVDPAERRGGEDQRVHACRRARAARRARRVRRRRPGRGSRTSARWRGRRRGRRARRRRRRRPGPRARSRSVPAAARPRAARRRAAPRRRRGCWRRRPPAPRAAPASSAASAALRPAPGRPAADSSGDSVASKRSVSSQHAPRRRARARPRCSIGADVDAAHRPRRPRREPSSAIDLRAPLPLEAPRPHRAARLAQPRGQLVDLGGAQLVGDPVGDEAGGALDDLLAHLEVVLLQGAAGGDQVDDAVAEADQRRQLDRALDLDHLDLAAGALEVALGDARVLGRDPHHPEAALGLAEALVALAPGEHHAAAAEAEVEQLVDACGRPARAARPCR